ncbi:MAG: DUF4388 domain-containing protein [Acidobacteria bacterium]|jgi:tetratricopeptide (TPR) repeat protein|nr:DUF4388 domain-containing protein [Acidobacteriota bacterium]
MSLSGDFSTMPLPDLLQWLAMSQKTGILILQRGDVVKEIYFRDGKIISSSSNDPREFFGQFLLAYGKISEEDLLAAFKKQAQTGIKLGRLLVMDGHLSEDDVQRFLRIKAEEAIYDLFLWEDGDFKFFNDVPSQANHVPIAMDVTSILMEGTRRADEWARIRKIFPSQETIVSIIPENLTREILADPLYNRMIQLMESPRRILDLCLMFHSNDFAVNKTLYDMYSIGIIGVVRAAEEKALSHMSPEEHIRLLCNHGLKQFNAGEYEACVETFKQAKTLDPNNALAETMIHKAFGELKHTLVSDVFTIEHVPYLQKSLHELNDMTFTPQENYIISRINGVNTVQAILRLSPIQELQALMIFKRLAKDGFIGFLPPSEESTGP